MLKQLYIRYNDVHLVCSQGGNICSGSFKVYPLNNRKQLIYNLQETYVDN